MLKQLRQLASESLVYGIAGVISRFVAIFLVPITTRVFSPADYGVIGLVSTTMALVSILVTLALDNSTARWYWDTDDPCQRKITLASWVWCQLVVSLFAAGLVIGFAGFLAQAIVADRGASVYFQVGAITLPLTGLGTVLTKWLRYQRRAWATVFYSSAYAVLSVLLTILLVAGLRMGITGMFLGQLLSALLGALLAFFVMRDWLHPRYFRWSRLQEMLRYSLPLIPGGLALWSLSLVDRYFVQYYASTEQVGLYQVGSSIAACVGLGVTAFTQAWAPFAYSIEKSPDARRVYAGAFLAYVWLGCLLSAAVTLFAPEALSVFTTRAYAGASTVVGALSLCWLLEGLYFIASLGPGLVRRTKPVGVAVAIAAILNIALNFALIPRWGKEGAAMATLLSQAVRAVYLFYCSQELYPIPYRFATALALVAASCGMIWISSGWRFDNLWMALIAKLACLSLFVPGLLMLRIVTLRQVRRILSRPALASA